MTTLTSAARSPAPQEPGGKGNGRPLARADWARLEAPADRPARVSEPTGGVGAEKDMGLQG